MNQPGVKKPFAKKAPAKKDAAKKKGPPVSSSALRVRRTADGGAWELVHPRCARDRAEDVEEVRKMIDAGETEIAVDELRWLLSGCSDFIDAHRLLGELALAEEDLSLARGHFGYAHRLGMKALEQAKAEGPLPYRLPVNESFHEAGKGLAYCLLHLGKRELASEVVEQLLRCDPSDPLGLRKLLESK
jgi:tetratricopeptide (TPR) repeat protein